MFHRIAELQKGSCSFESTPRERVRKQTLCSKNYNNQKNVFMRML